MEKNWDAGGNLYWNILEEGWRINFVVNFGKKEALAILSQKDLEPPCLFIKQGFINFESFRNIIH